jgi:cation diffusion facilitator CzcD-associated flavoprotein CzcO
MDLHGISFEKRNLLRFGGDIQFAILGAGPTGCIIADRLTRQGVGPNSIRLIDPSEKPLQAWEHHNTSIGRTPNGFYTIKALLTPLAIGEQIQTRYLITPTRVKAVIQELRQSINSLMRCYPHLYVQGEAVRVARDNQAFKIELNNSQCITANHVVCAVGGNDQPMWPKWATALKQTSPEASLSHVFDLNFVRRRDVLSKGHIVVVGSGRNAIDLALHLSEKRAYFQYSFANRL